MMVPLGMVMDTLPAIAIFFACILIGIGHIEIESKSNDAPVLRVPGRVKASVPEEVRLALVLVEQINVLLMKL